MPQPLPAELPTHSQEPCPQLDDTSDDEAVQEQQEEQQRLRAAPAAVRAQLGPLPYLPRLLLPPGEQPPPGQPRTWFGFTGAALRQWAEQRGAARERHGALGDERLVMLGLEGPDGGLAAMELGSDDEAEVLAAGGWPGPPLELGAGLGAGSSSCDEGEPDELDGDEGGSDGRGEASSWRGMRGGHSTGRRAAAGSSAPQTAVMRRAWSRVVRMGGAAADRPPVPPVLPLTLSLGQGPQASELSFDWALPRTMLPWDSPQQRAALRSGQQLYAGLPPPPTRRGSRTRRSAGAGSGEQQGSEGGLAPVAPLDLRRVQPPAPCSFLARGVSFEGRQHMRCSGLPRRNEHWSVRVTVHDVDQRRGWLCGVMQAREVPSVAGPVATFFEGQVVDDAHHSFYTGAWGASRADDLQHWARFPSFAPLKRLVVARSGHCGELQGHSHVYMRWKEAFFLGGSQQAQHGLTISGLYYVALERATGSVQGFYFDPASAPHQELSLELARHPAWQQQQQQAGVAGEDGEGRAAQAQPRAPGGGICFGTYEFA